MSARAARARQRSALAAVVAVLALLVAFSATASAADGTGTPVPTSVTLEIRPEGPVGTTTSVDFVAVVTPASARGRILFSFVQNGTAVVYGDPVGGVATVTTRLHNLGTQMVTAQFVPEAGTAFETSMSAPGTLVIVTTPGLTLLRASGTAVPTGSQVGPGETLQARIAGFLPSTLVDISVDGTVLVKRLFLSSEGAASTLLALPRSLPGGGHVITARSADLSASASVSSVVAPVDATPTEPLSESAQPTPPSTPPPAPSYSTAGSAAPQATTPSAPTAGAVDGSSTDLASTGSNPLSLVLLAAILFLGGGALLRIPSEASAGAHDAARARSAVGGRHQTRTARRRALSTRSRASASQGRHVR